ncbi:MAG TPA: hypothetical protein VGB07_01925 [Blastocatellia bacterium]
MTTRRITEIEIETHELLIIRRKGHAVRPLCQECGETETMATPDEAALLIGDSLRTVFRWIESGTIHFTETADGGLYICTNSLPQANQQAVTPTLN